MTSLGFYLGFPEFSNLEDDISRSDRRPPGQRSPYEAIGLGGKIQKPPETRAEHVQGCGNPACEICMPKGRPQDAGGDQRGGDSTVVTAAVVKEAILRNLTLPLGSTFFDVSAVIPTTSTTRDDTATRQRASAESAEQRLRSKVESYLLKTSHQVGWDDVVGNAAARAALEEAIEHPVKHAELYRFYAVRPTKGVLLYGPPGCGKTMFGKAAATVLARVHGRTASDPVLLKINGPEIQSPYVGVTEEKIRDIFAYARAYKALHGIPLTVFIDEADAILPSRDGRGGRRALPWEESQVASFLTEMDGLEDSGAFVILATNRPHAIDEAVLRDGRCDRKIKVERPGLDAAAAIVGKALAGMPLAGLASTPEGLAAIAVEAMFDPFRRLSRVVHAKGVDFLTLGHICNGAMLVGLVEQAKGFAFRRDLASGGSPSGISPADLLAAVDSVEAQNRGLGHSDAVIDLVEAIDAEVREVLPVRVGRIAA